MPERKPFLLRIDPAVLKAVQRWADDELRSLNGQIEFLLTHALREAGRMRETAASRARPAEAGRREREDKPSKP